ncbi:MAG: hypothetical protein WAM70_13400 [Pyrinomonadaceae bacterium]
MKPKALFVGLLFVGSLTATAFIVAKVRPVQNGQGFSLVLNVVDYPADGSAPRISTVKVRNHKANGDWRLQNIYPNGRVDVGFGQMGRGVFHVDEKNQRLEYLSGASLRDVSEAKLRSLPGFVAEETFLGYKVFHYRTVTDETGEVTDTYVCPALQGYPVKVVSTSRHGAKNITEVVQVIPGEPSFTVADYPVDTKHYEAVHEKKP